MSAAPLIPGSDNTAIVSALFQQAIAEIAAGNVGNAAAPVDAFLGMDESVLSEIPLELVRAWHNIAISLAQAQDLALARRLFQGIFQMVEKRPEAAPVHLVAPLYGLLTVCKLAGDGGGFNETAARMVELAKRLNDPLGEFEADCFLPLGLQFENAGCGADANVLLDQVERYVRQPNVPVETSLAWLCSRGKVYFNGGHLAALIRLCQSAIRPLAERADHPVAIAIELVTMLMHAARAAGTPAVAEAALERAVQIADASMRGRNASDSNLDMLAGVAAHNLAQIFLSQKRADQYQRAEALLQYAFDISGRLNGVDSIDYARSANLLAVAKSRLGKLEEADAQYVKAAAICKDAPGRSDGELSHFLTDLGMHRVVAMASREAVPPLEQAFEIRMRTPDESASRRADAASYLATACFETGDLTRARDLYYQSLDLRLADSR